MKLKTPFGRKAMTNLGSMLKSRDITLLTKVCINQSYGFFSSHIWMWELDHKETWVPKNWCFQTVVLRNTLESPLDSKIKPVNPKGNQHWILIGRVGWCWSWSSKLWPSDEKNWFIGKDPDGWERLKVREEGDRGWDGWMASLTQWRWVWANSRRWWRTGKPDVLRSQSCTQPSNWITTTSMYTCMCTHMHTHTDIYMRVCVFTLYWALVVAQMVKNSPALKETWVRSLCLEDSLEKGMATHSSIRAWKIPWTEEPGGLQFMGLHRVGHG